MKELVDVLPPLSSPRPRRFLVLRADPHGFHSGVVYPALSRAVEVSSSVMSAECVPTGHFPEAVARPIVWQSLERHLNFESPGPSCRLAH